MSTDINGWIEVKIPGYDDWYGAVSLTVAGERDYWIFDCLFGTGRVSPPLLPLAERRGTPQGLSPESRADLAEFGGSTPQTMTWLSWSEIPDVDWTRPVDWPTAKGVERIEASEGWKLLFSLCRFLSGQYGAHNVRFVAWFGY
jgi:hypothetical protein